jgi:hypothetical protein
MAVAAEINRRNRLASPGHADDEPASTPIPVREKRSTSEELPEGKVNLIRASLNAGVKPATIARTFHVSPSSIQRVISSTEKPKRQG